MILSYKIDVYKRQQTTVMYPSESLPESKYRPSPFAGYLPVSYTHLSAAMNLTRIQRPWLVTSCEWNDKLIRSAIV